MNETLAPASLASPPRVLCAGSGIARIPQLAGFLAGEDRVVVGWGRKASGQRARWLAWLLGRRCLWLEDGLLSRVARTGPRLSLLVDDLGVYYDARRPSRLEAATAAGTSLQEALRALELARLWVAEGLSKANHARDFIGDLPARYVLLADQCAGDLSIRHGLASPASFAAMLKAALAEHDGTVLVKLHPEVARGRRPGHLTHAAAHPRVRLIAADCHPARLIAGAEAVYSVTSQLGFEALLHGRPLRCFGMPFYAGWGLSEDALPAPARRGKASLADLTHAAFCVVARHVDPASGAPITAEAAFAAAGVARRAWLAAEAIRVASRAR